MGGRAIVFSEEELKEMDAALAQAQNRILHLMLYSEEPRSDYPLLHLQHKTLREARSKIGKELGD